MMGTLFNYWISVLFLPSFRAAWIIGNNLLPRSDDEMAVGAYNGSIFIFGGYRFRSSFVQFDIATESVTDHGRNAITQSEIHGAAQHWTQQGSIIYMIADLSPNAFHIYDMSSNQYTSNWKEITFTTYVGDDGCLASSELFLYVSGGDPDGINALQILSLTTYSWINNPPNMLQRRQHHSCVFHNDYLWAFGGQWTPTKNNVELATNERIQAADITGTQNTWNYIDSLTLAIEFHRAAVYLDTIYIIGGHDGDSNEYDFVHLVDANTGAVTLSGDRMQNVNHYGAPIIVDSILYVFGGFEVDGSITNQWQYYPLDITTGDPTEITVAPIAAPTDDPIAAPTEHPTDSPTDHPVAIVEEPTAAPIDSRTNHPSFVPSNDPSEEPTAAPIDSRTDHPIIGPSEEPSPAPIDLTIYPSKQVTKIANEYIYTSQSDESVIENEREREDDHDPVYESTQNELVAAQPDNDAILGLAIGAGSMLVIGAIITFVCFLYFKKKELKQEEQVIIQMTKAQSISAVSASAVTTTAQVENVTTQMGSERVDERGERDDEIDLKEEEGKEDSDSEKLYEAGKTSLGMTTKGGEVTSNW